MKNDEDLTKSDNRAAMWVKKHRPRKLTPEEQQESINQRKDEARLRFITLASYNPLSNKYKALKKQL